VTRTPRATDPLLASEIERRVALFGDPSTPHVTLRAALHALVGSASMAGHTDLALVISQGGARLAEGDEQARFELFGVLSSAASRLRAGEEPFATRWPEPPPALRASRVEPSYRVEYFGAVRDRLGQLDAALSSTDALSALEQAQRSVHTLKGAASAVGDDVTAWYCHGLETELRRAARTEQVARECLVDLARHRALVALLAENSQRGLDALRALGAHSRVASEPQRVPPPLESEPERRFRTQPPEPDRAVDDSLRIPSSALDTLLERLDRVDRVHDDLGRGNVTARRAAARLRDLRASVGEALRALGPPRPWGPSHAAIDRLESVSGALSALAASADRAAHGFRQGADFLRGRSDEMRRDVSALRKTTMGSVFERVAHAAVRFAEADSKLVRVEIAGGDVALDRRAAERLVDGLVQLVRNAVAHGIALPGDRLSQGKRAEGTLRLRAERRGEALRIVVEDDGAGVDVERIRELSQRSGLLAPDVATRATERELLSLLFLPGLTTQSDPGLMAGRGIGLELVESAVRSLGGTIELEQRESGGLRATLRVPVDQTVLDVLWLEEAGHEFALPVAFTGALSVPDPTRAAVPLSQCLPLGGGARRREAGVEVELSIAGLDPIAVSVERAGTIEEVTVRALPRLIAASGPYSGAVLRGDGSLLLALDAPLLAARAWAKRGARAP
jgi:two-component system chemotaxis sensor kinase CheA